MSVKVTERTYSRDNHEFSFCVVEPGDACWIAWSAYGLKGSRSFVRFFDGRTANEISPISDADNMQACPLCAPGPNGVVFAWLEKDGDAYALWRRGHDGSTLTQPEAVHCLPPRAQPSRLQACVDAEGALWAAWAEASRAESTIRVLHAPSGAAATVSTLTAGALRDYRPSLAALESGGVHLVWDAYVDGVYDVYGCAVAPSGPSPAARISRDREWENKASVCRDAAGRLWCVWVRCKDATWKDSVVHQKFSIRGARLDGGSWLPLSGSDGGADLALLHYGLLTDFDRAAPALGHQGRRLHPMLRAADDGGVWLFYETKADDAAQTLDSKGRFCALRCSEDVLTPPLTVAEGLVYYELPENDRVGSDLFLVARDVDFAKPDHDVDELHLDKVRLATDLPPVPVARRTVDLTHWKEVELPFPSLARGVGAQTRLPGRARGLYHLIWGDFHVHSNGSVECEGEPDELAHYARDKGGLQALTVSDNDSFWNHSVRQNQRWLTDSEWDANLGNAKVINEPGRFALFPGYEQTIGPQTTDEQCRRLLRNHTSVMADDDDMQRETFHLDPDLRQALAEGRRMSCKNVVDCVNWARETGCYPLPHAHVNWWRLVDPAVQTACDVTAAWMRNIECFDIYHTYLNRGLKFGFTGSSDSHYRNPGLGGAVTGLWVTETSRAAVLEALRARRTYATAGQRLLLEFTVADAFMGDWVVVTDDPTIRWRVAGEDGEEYLLRVRRDGRAIHEETFVGRTQGELLDETLVIHHQGEHYYYLEVISSEPIPDYKSNAAHALGGRAWSTPVWVETADWLGN